ncbi:MAG: aminotransferase class I/II-fold pyridoxal phosphate-dependent enzyme [Sphingomonadaceae bacterium]|uniref:pyridoxal phosphate-dependent aminotransferase n=1 Tax=Thermaurantiacus sp. TaxID=2820283 RepID=UPI00298F071A|nr:histidinol-phosphate transaminase [Thermaurantiacus sp.]MCS6987231.1 aminotransferase class I/II-fold pyridoxal phosphate-dependent enzyme [Sphingomonadaceae bacterium]MDW8414451.1 histidinol-phosphate transaminase [Thermaurantiacus sp.]
MDQAMTRRGLMGAVGWAVAVGAAPPARGATAQAELSVHFAPPAGVAFLARNENPYGPSAKALAAMAEVARHGCRYANGAEAELAARIARRFGLTPDHVMVGQGSTEVLNCAAMALGLTRGIVAAELTFDPPLRWAEAKGVAVRRVPLRSDMGVDLEALAATGPAGLVHLVNPNNPTGLLIPGETVRNFVAALSPKTPVLVDEAYIELADGGEAHSAIPRIRAGDRVVVTRTFSKLHGLAGLRVGYALGHPELIAAMRGWSMSNGGNAAGLAAALASLEDEAFLAFSRERIRTARERLAAAARAHGLEVLPSHANFVFARVGDAERLRARLAERGVIVRGPYPGFPQWSRVSCGRLEDVERYAAELPRALAG